MALRKFLNNLFLQWCLKQTHLAPVLPAMNLGKVYSPASTTCCSHLEMTPVQPPSFTSCPVGNKPICPLPEPGHGQSSQSDLNYRSALLSLPTCLCLDLFLPDFRKKVGFYEKVEVFLWLKKSRLWGGFHDVGQHAHAEASKKPLQNNQSRKIQV